MTDTEETEFLEYTFALERTLIGVTPSYDRRLMRLIILKLRAELAPTIRGQLQDVEIEP